MKLGNTTALARLAPYWNPNTRLVLAAIGAVWVARGLGKGLAAVAHVAFGSALLAASAIDSTAQLRVVMARPKQQRGTPETASGFGAIVPT